MSTLALSYDDHEIIDIGRYEERVIITVRRGKPIIVYSCTTAMITSDFIVLANVHEVERHEKLSHYL